MNDTEIIEKVKKSIDCFISNEQWLITNDLNEKSLTHKLALNLFDYFNEYDIDCEYNGNIDSGNGRKRINVLKEDLIQKGLLKKSELELELEIINRAVFPDIIIHKRGRNDMNLCIIEVKKSTSRVNCNYDFLKLSAYTTNNYGNELNYQLGIFIKFNTGSSSGYQLEFFKNGTQMPSQ